eukprot:4024599-Ditylum_brightwellii.AAC.2
MITFIVFTSGDVKPMFLIQSCRMVRRSKSSILVHTNDFLGYSSKHATNVGLILNINTKCISPQFHAMYDDFFTAVYSVEDAHNHVLINIDWDHLVDLIRTEHHFDPSESHPVSLIYPEWNIPPHAVLSPPSLLESILRPKELPKEPAPQKKQVLFQSESELQRESKPQRESISPAPAPSPLQIPINTEELSSYGLPTPEEMALDDLEAEAQEYKAKYQEELLPPSTPTFFSPLPLLLCPSS